MRTSAAVLALFLGSAAALQRAPTSYSYFATGMNGDEDLGEDITMKGDRFHYHQAAPTYASASALIMLNDAPAEKAPSPDKVHVLEPEVYQAASNGPDAFPNQRTAFYVQEDDNEPEKVHTLDPKIAREHTTFYDKKNGVWRQVLAETEDAEHPHPAVAGPGEGAPIGSTVHKASVEGGDSIPNHRDLQTSADPLGPTHMDAWVYEFSNENMPPYANEHYKKKKRDIGEVKMDEEVHGFANDKVDVLPNIRREGAPYDYNGSGPKAHPASFMQRQKRDIGEVKMEENVHWFANDQVDVLPNTRKEGAPYDYNGSGPKAHPASFVQRKKRDIGEVKMDEEVHGFSNDKVDVLPNIRREGAPYDYNGSGPKAHPAFMQKGDIANTEVRPDVYEVVNKAVNPTPLWRSDVPPEKRKNGYFDYEGTSGFKNLK